MTTIDWPDIEGLSVRLFKGKEDFPGMVDVINASKAVDKKKFSYSIEDMERAFEHPINTDPYKDELIVLMGEKIIGTTMVWWSQGLDKIRNYNYTAKLVPEWRGKGIREAMVKWCENRAREIAKTHPEDEVGQFYIWASEFEKDWTRIVESNGFKPHTYSFIMVRPNLDNIPDCPLPSGIEIRPVNKDQMRMLWDADMEAHKDGFEPVDWPEELYLQWLNEPIFKPEHYIVAWDGEKIAGAVQNHIDPNANIEFDRKRGYTENIHVGREWRGQGLAKAMISISFQTLKDLGMEEASLNVEADNPTGALKLYTRMGFETEKKVTHYKKPLW